MFLVGFFYLCCFCLCDLSSFLWAHFYCHPIFHFLLIYLYISLVYLWVGFLFSFPFPFDTTYYEVMLESMCVFFLSSSPGFFHSPVLQGFSSQSRFFSNFFNHFFPLSLALLCLPLCTSVLLPSAPWWLPSLTSYVSLHLILSGDKQASCLTAWVVNVLGRTQCTHASPTGSQTSTNFC